MSRDLFRQLSVYLTTISIMRKLTIDGVISAEEYDKMDTIFAQKYGISSCSIYRCNHLIPPSSRGNM